MTTSQGTTLDSPAPTQPGDEAQHGRLQLVARHFVDSGKVVPSIVLDVQGTARSQWIPLPAANDRPLVAALLDEDTPEAHLRVARLLAEEVDRLTRSRLRCAEARLVARRGGRRSVPHVWLESLSSIDPVLPGALAADKVAAFTEAVQDWVASGAVTLGRARLCLRVHEPGSHPDLPFSAPTTATFAGSGDTEALGKTDSEADWWVELLIQDAEEPSLMVPIAELWAGGCRSLPARSRICCGPRLARPQWHQRFPTCWNTWPQPASPSRSTSSCRSSIAGSSLWPRSA